MSGNLPFVSTHSFELSIWDLISVAAFACPPQPRRHHHRCPQESRTRRAAVQAGNASSQCRSHMIPMAVVLHLLRAAVIKGKLSRCNGTEAAQPGSTDLSVFSATSSWRGVSKRTPWADRGRWRKWHTASPSWHPMLPASSPASTFPSTGAVTRCARDETGDVEIKQCNGMALIPLCLRKEVCLSKNHLIY